jgi:hypothetical protein
MTKKFDEKDYTEMVEPCLNNSAFVDSMGNDDGAMDGENLEMLDANYTCTPISYTKLDGSGNALTDDADSWVMVRDNDTGLIWETKTDDGTIHDHDNQYTWYNSNLATNCGNAGTPGDGTNTENFIKALNNANYGGFSDWRLPTLRELCTIIYDMPPQELTINTNYFPNTQPSFYWSSTTDTFYPCGAWGVYFHIRLVSYANKSNSYYIRAVRGGQPGSFDTVYSGTVDDASHATNIYTDNSDGTVTDISSSLMWQQASSSKEMAWEQALAYCEKLKLGGYIDWRLPALDELRDLVDGSRHSPAINTNYFPNTHSSNYWSSTTYAYYTGYAWLVYFDIGSVSCTNKYNSSYVRAVRGGQSRALEHSVISVSPVSQDVAKDAGSTTVSVSKTVTGTMPWAAIVTSGGSWLSITSGGCSGNSGTVNCIFTMNTSALARTATIRIIGAIGSSTNVKLTQAGRINNLQRRRRNDKNRKQRQLQRNRTLG